MANNFHDNPPMKRRVLEEAGCFSGDSTPSDARDVNSGVKMDGWKKAVAAAKVGESFDFS